MTYLEREQASGRRLVGVALVLVLHVALVYGLINGLARKVVEVIRLPLETKMIDDLKQPPPDKPPPPPPPKLAPPPPPYIPPVEVQIQVPAAPSSRAITTVTNVKPVEAPPPPRAAPVVAAPPKRTPAVVSAANCDKPEYPSASLRAQETGVVGLAFLIDVDGKVLESKVQTSSGHRRLDAAALNALALCKFKPATVDGKPEKEWARIEYEWKIE